MAPPQSAELPTAEPAREPEPVIPVSSPGCSRPLRRLRRPRPLYRRLRLSDSTPATSTPATSTPATSTPQAGEFTSKFLASQPAESSTPVVAPRPAAQQAGEFTSKFLASPAQPLAPASPPSQPGEFTNKFLTLQQPQPPSVPASDEATRPFNRSKLRRHQQRRCRPDQHFRHRCFQHSLCRHSLCPYNLCRHRYAVAPASEEPTRLFQAVSPSPPSSFPPVARPPAPAPAASQGTRRVHPDVPVRQARFARCTYARTAAIGSAGQRRSQRIHALLPIPDVSDSGGQSASPSSPQSGIPLGPAVNRPSAQASEFTQMFGNPNRPDSGAATPPPPPLGSAGTFGPPGSRDRRFLSS